MGKLNRAPRSGSVSDQTSASSSASVCRAVTEALLYARAAPIILDLVAPQGRTGSVGVPGHVGSAVTLARVVGRAYAAANRRDFDVVLMGWDPGSEYRPSADLMPPDVEPIFHGHDGMRQLWRYWLDAFEDIRWDPEEILDLGEKVLVTAQQRGHGSGSGVSVSEPVFQLFTFRGGLVVR